MIIGGDFNEHHTSSNILSDILDIHQLCNASQKFNLERVPTYKRSSHILDFVFVSKGLYLQLEDMKMREFNKWTNTDHRPIQISVTVNEKVDFKSTDTERNLRTKNPKQYIKTCQNTCREMELLKKLIN